MPQYLPRPGSRILKSEAQIIGEAMERCRRRRRYPFTVAQFEALCQNPNDPVHPVWMKYRDKYEAAAGRSAASYMLRSVEIVITNPDGGRTIERAAPILLEAGSTPYSQNGRVYLPSDIRGDNDLLDRRARQFLSDFMGIARPAADLLGAIRVRQIIMEALLDIGT